MIASAAMSAAMLRRTVKSDRLFLNEGKSDSEGLALVLPGQRWERSGLRDGLHGRPVKEGVTGGTVHARLYDEPSVAADAEEHLGSSLGRKLAARRRCPAGGDQITDAGQLVSYGKLLDPAGALVL